MSNNDQEIGLNLYYQGKRCFYPINLRMSLFPDMRRGDPERVVHIKINGSEKLTQVRLKDLKTEDE